MAEFVLIPALIIGAVIGLLELFFIHADESFRGSHWFGHGLHAIGWAMIAVFASINVDYVFEVVPTIASIPILGNALYFRIAIGLVTLIKTYTTSAVVAGARGRGMHEKLWHCLAVAGLVVASGYVYPYILPIFPEFLR